MLLKLEHVLYTSYLSFWWNADSHLVGLGWGWDSIYSCCCYPWTISLIRREEGLQSQLPVLGVMLEERTGRSQHSVRDVCLPPLHRDSLNPLLLVWCPMLQCAWCSQIQTLGFNSGEKLLLFCLGWGRVREACAWSRGKGERVFVGDGGGVWFLLDRRFTQFCFALIFATTSRGTWFCQFLRIKINAVCKASWVAARFF